MKSFAILSLLFFSSVGLARSVDIAVKKGQTELTLSNPSTVPVSYDAVCHSADGTGTVLNATGQTLAPNAKVDLTVATVDTGKCAGNVNPNYTWIDSNGKNVYSCSGSVQYSNAASLCGTGQSFCMPLHQQGVTGCSSYIYSSVGAAWVKSDDANVYYTTSCSWNHDITTNAVAFNPSGCTNYFARHTSVASTAEYYYGMDVVPKSNTNGAVCCEGSGDYSSYCRITINNSDTEGRLLSPSFKNGAAF